jgi:hypothetical protein
MRHERGEAGLLCLTVFAGDKLTVAIHRDLGHPVGKPTSADSAFLDVTNGERPACRRTHL